MFWVRPLEWTPPEPSGFDALLLTSANAAAHAGPPLRVYDALPCYCVGETTAAAAREAGLDRIRVGASDGTAVLEMMAADNMRTALHLCGREHMPLGRAEIRLDHRVVYAADPVADLAPEAVRAVAEGALALIHSPRAARLFGELVDEAGLDRARLAVAAISPAAAQALGDGWGSVSAAAAPRDEALLELAAKLCQTGAMGGAGQTE
jgi:uroporphyrinogen-III synthase